MPEIAPWFSAQVVLEDLRTGAVRTLRAVDPQPWSPEPRAVYCKEVSCHSRDRGSVCCRDVKPDNAGPAFAGPTHPPSTKAPRGRPEPAPRHLRVSPLAQGLPKRTLRPSTKWCTLALPVRTRPCQCCDKDDGYPLDTHCGMNPWRQALTPCRDKLSLPGIACLPVCPRATGG